MAQNFYIGLGQGYTDGFNVSSDVLDAYRADLNTRGVKLNASDTPAFASDFIDYVHRTKTPLPNPNGISYSDFGNLMATFGNGGAGLLNYVTQNPTGAVNYQSQPDGTMKVIAGAPPVQQQQSTPAPQQTYTPAYKAIILANGQEVNYDYAQPAIKAAADAGQYKIKSYAQVGTPPAGTPAAGSNPGGSTSPVSNPPASTSGSNQNIYNPSTGQKGYQVPGAAIPAGWLAIPAGGVPNASPSGTQTGQTTSATVGGAPPAQTTPTINIPAQPLQPGATGDAVKQLQDMLVSLGLMTAAQVATGPGIYGPQTTAAVKALQEQLGVDNSTGPGYFGPRTIAALQQYVASQSQQGGNPGGTTGNPGSTTGGTTGNPNGTGGVGGGGPADSYLEGSNTNLASLLAGVGINLGPQTSLSDMVKQLATLYGLDEINGEMKKLDDQYANDVAAVNDDPWISEGIRITKISKLKDKYDSKKLMLTNRLALNKDVVGQAVTLFNAEKSQEQALLLKALDAKLSATDSTKTTTDITEYNVARTQGFKGTLLDWQTKQANLKAVKPSTININTSASTSAEQQLLDARGSDGYTDPNLYASVRAKSTLSPTVFNDKFGYLVNPASRQRLGVSTVAPPKTSNTINFGDIPSL